MSAFTGGNPDSNTLISDMTTVICLDDYHSLDRQGRKKESVTALDPKAQNFDLMYQQIKDLKDGKTVAKPIYNHVSGLLDPPEDTSAPRVRPSPTPLLPCCPCHMLHSCQSITHACCRLIAQYFHVEVHRLDYSSELLFSTPALKLNSAA